MLTLEKIMSELKVNSVNEIVGGDHGRSKRKTTKKSKTKTHRHKSHKNYY